MSVEHTARDGADGVALMVLRVAVPKDDATNMPGLVLEAPPHPGEAGAGPDVRRDIGGAISLVGSFPSEFGIGEGKVGTSQVGELTPSVGVPLAHGAADVGVQ